MTRTRLTGPEGRLDLTLDGVVFYRSKSRARAKATGRVLQLEWPDIAVAEVTRTGKGRPVVRIAAQPGTSPSRIRDDPCAMKFKRKQLDAVQEFVELVNHEAELRRRWRRAGGDQHADS